jgi:hypothetical protein
MHFKIKNRIKRAGGMDQEVESLPGKRKALSSNPNTTKTKQRIG